MEIDILGLHSHLHQVYPVNCELPNTHLERALDGLKTLRMAGHTSFIDSEIVVKRCYAEVLIAQRNYPLAVLHVAQAFLLSKTGHSSNDTMNKLAELVDLLKTKMTD